MPAREATHAGSWYSDDGPALSRELDHYLDQVPDQIEGLGSLPVPGARVIIGPHAGYSYSGPCAAFAYKSLDLSNAKRIFLIGPSHHHHLSTLALPRLTSYETPLSTDPLPLDTDLISKLLNDTTTPVRFTTMSPSVDEAEHSLELHLPYIHHMLRRKFPSTPTSSYPPLVPIMVGSTSPSTERAFGEILAPYLADPSNAFIISSDFCHWGSRFGYTYYVPEAPYPGPNLPLSHTSLPQPSSTSTQSIESTIKSVSGGHPLRSRSHVPSPGPKIHESISSFDIATMAAIASGETDSFLEILRQTSNTVCGRHPIGVIMAALEAVAANGDGEEGGKGKGNAGEGGIQKGKFNFIRYERSSDAVSVSDSSVSYVSAFAVL
ncbi:hypothetical protein FQN54_003843 [Arachnomyces sp. PD_36]|nr:hypothetical protein FQN54_003843 [Arachnomyces sp. PD_36]